MKLHHTLRATIGVAAVAIAVALGTGAALAQPMGGPHRAGGPGGPGEMIGHLIANAKAELKLNTMQQAMFDAAVVKSKAAHESGRALHAKVRDALQAELAKAEPDLAAVAAAADAAHEQGRALRTAVRAEWLSLYGQFSAEQKALVRDLMQKRLSNAESFRQKKRERMHHFRDRAAG
jgi:Spy/CpxP family protein refolding chaperone